MPTSSRVGSSVFQRRSGTPLSKGNKSLKSKAKLPLRSGPRRRRSGPRLYSHFQCNNKALDHILWGSRLGAGSQEGV
jgi:hypothetical protein